MASLQPSCPSLVFHLYLMMLVVVRFVHVAQAFSSYFPRIVFTIAALHFLHSRWSLPRQPAWHMCVSYAPLSELTVGMWLGILHVSCHESRI
jgi:hypothetical protein